MDYGTRFINNLSIKEETAYSANVRLSDSSSFKCNVLKSCKIIPGIIGIKKDLKPSDILDGSYAFAVLDNNLRGDSMYSPDYKIVLNEASLSFNKITFFKFGENAYTDQGTRINKYNNKFYVSSTTFNGQILSPCILPLDLNLSSASAIIKNRFRRSITSNADLYDIRDMSNNLHPLLALDGCKNFLILGVYAKNASSEINPSGVSNPTSSSEYALRDKATSVIVSAWNLWIRSYETPGLHTFEDYLNYVLSSQSIAEDIKFIIRNSLKICTDNINYWKNYSSTRADNYGTIKFKIDGVYYDAYGYSDSTHDKDIYINGLGFVSADDKFYCYDSGKLQLVYISYIGDFSVSNDSSKLQLMYLSKDLASVLRYTYYQDLAVNFEKNSIYPVGVVARQIIEDTITLIENGNSYAFRKANRGSELSFSTFILDRTIEDNSEVIITEDELNKEIESDTFITPNEYYSGTVSFNDYANSENGYAKAASSDSNDDVPVWFWSNTLMNWCTFRNFTTPNTIRLYVWNGKNGWNSLTDVLNDPKRYTYNVNALKKGIDFSVNYNYDDIVIKYKTIPLVYDSTFSQYTNEFQTIRLGKVYINDTTGDYRYPYTIGMPPVSRLASGEMALMYELTIPACNIDNPVIFPEQIKFINLVCRQHFGAGDEKTIMDDWKRINKTISRSDTPSNIASLSDSSLVDADEINTVKDTAANVSMIFIPFKQYIETDNIETDAYVERWS